MQSLEAAEILTRRLQKIHGIRSVLTDYGVGSFESSIVRNLANEILDAIEGE